MNLSMDYWMRMISICKKQNTVVVGLVAIVKVMEIGRKATNQTRVSKITLIISSSIMTSIRI